MASRQAVKAGTWYPEDPDVIRDRIGGWFENVTDSVNQTRVIIVPHAGYQYSGFTAAHSYKAAPQPHTVLLLHPSHHKFLHRLYQTPFDNLETPLGPLERIRIPGIKENCPLVDTQEHSAELQFPFLKYINTARIATVMVGHTWSDADLQMLVDFVHANKDVLIVVSSDFCHYGPNYGFTLQGNVDNNTIKELDLQAFQCIKSKNVDSFQKYLHDSGNTICGRYAIILVMRLISACYPSGDWNLLHYSQSSDLKEADNCVSYLSAAYCI